MLLVIIIQISWSLVRKGSNKNDATINALIIMVCLENNYFILQEGGKECKKHERHSIQSIFLVVIFTQTLASIVSADKEKEGIQSRHEATLIAGYDIPMQIMAEILEDKNVLHQAQSPSRSDNDYLGSGSISQHLPASIKTSGASGQQPRDLVFSILSDEGRREALERLSSRDGNRVERNVEQSPRNDKPQRYNTATFLINSGFQESHFERLFSQVREYFITYIFQIVFLI